MTTYRPDPPDYAAELDAADPLAHRGRFVGADTDLVYSTTPWVARSA